MYALYKWKSKQQNQVQPLLQNKNNDIYKLIRRTIFLGKVKLLHFIHKIVKLMLSCELHD